MSTTSWKRIAGAVAGWLVILAIAFGVYSLVTGTVAGQRACREAPVT
jgi:hypothetical protein